MLLFTDTDLQRAFPSAYLKRGRDYQASGRVRALKINDDGRRFTATVQGNAKRPYRTDIVLTRTRKGATCIEGSCSCPMVYNCKHVAAVLLDALANADDDAGDSTSPATPASLPIQRLNPAVQNWLDGVARTAQGAKPAGTTNTPEKLLYLLKLEHLPYTTRAVIEYKLITQGTVEEKIAALQARKQALADGVFGKTNTHAPALAAEDLEMLFSPLE